MACVERLQRPQHWSKGRFWKYFLLNFQFNENAKLLLPKQCVLTEIQKLAGNIYLNALNVCLNKAHRYFP